MSRSPLTSFIFTLPAIAPAYPVAAASASVWYSPWNTKP